MARFFKPEEFACKCGCGYDEIEPLLVVLLDDLRAWLGTPIRVNSACRCPAHNKAVNGKPHSYHLSGRAADISFSIPAGGRDQIREKLVSMFPGVIEYQTFFHVDTRHLPYHLLRKDYR